ncbi:ABC transporter substrate-binding protein, partial [Achromobacter xylosoxidans]
MRRRDFIKAASLLAGASAPAIWTGRAAAAAKPVTLKFDSYISETSGPSRLDEWYLKQLETRSNGAVKVRRYWAQSLNKVGEHLSAVRDGTSEMSLISPGYYQAQLPVTRGLDWYYRMHRSDALQWLCRDVYAEYQPLRDEWERRYNSKVLYWTNWYYAPLVTRQPI